MNVPIFFPFLIPAFVTLVVLDKLTGGKITEDLEKKHDKELRKQFGWDRRE